MIVCTTCGHHNEDGDEFCGSCGSYLEFSGERIDTTEPPVWEPEPEAARPGLVQRVKEAVGIGEEDGTEAAPGEDDGDDARRQAEAEAEAEAARLEAERAEAARREAAAAEAARAEQARQEAERAEAAAAEAAAAERAAAEAAAALAAAEQAPPPPPPPPADPTAPPPPPPPADPTAAPGAPPTPGPPPPRAGSGGPPPPPPPPADHATEQLRLDAQRAEAQMLALRAEAEAAEEARQRAERAQAEAEEARLEAEEAKAAAEAEAERTRRASAMVARQATVQPAAPAAPAARPAVTQQPSGAGAAGSTGPAAQRPSTAPTGPTAVKPGGPRARPKPVAPAPPSRRINPGDRICGHCGEGNDPARNFCRRCGTSLAEAVVAKTPWWRKVVPRRRTRVVAAGERPGQATGRGPGSGRPKGGFGRKLKGAIAVGMGLVLLLAVFGPLRGPADDAVAKVKGIVAPEFENVSISGASSAASAEGHPPTFAIDRIANDYWAEGLEGNGEGAVLLLEFSEPTDLAKIGITPGAPDDEFTAQPRPRVLRVVAVGDEPVSKEITLEDSPDFQRFDFEASNVTRVEVHIEEVYTSTEGTACAIAELELFREKT